MTATPTARADGDRQVSGGQLILVQSSPGNPDRLSHLHLSAAGWRDFPQEVAVGIGQVHATQEPSSGRRQVRHHHNPAALLGSHSHLLSHSDQEAPPQVCLRGPRSEQPLSSCLPAGHRSLARISQNASASATSLASGHQGRSRQQAQEKYPDTSHKGQSVEPPSFTVLQGMDGLLPVFIPTGRWSQLSLRQP